ncbi:ABC transporter ATP-binding protein [Polaribacter sp. Asnod1-A03]|uniref:ABC transporter ATP-binding protein n=1 Tax=Polaribacter sp. Asnod1-A03 TaxID=3160581 RepID=UPI00386DF2E7
MKPIVEIENISKQYRLGDVGTGTLSHDLNRWWHTVRGKEDPYLEVGDVNDRSVKGVSDYVWALKDISFKVNPGEIVGVIGKNGAGKSTLLKLLSRVTAPTTGTITAYGRIASLLEVGTGFHPELTGKENVFLNGAIMGMTKAEITDKFDEIVEFAGCARYIDTPVKRYSSGMYVRLAFAVAAHLEPEILVVDEVLAVGDAEFQKKAIGKMKEVSQEQGRTVLFVSHNMGTIKQICNRCVVLGNGQVKFDGDVIEAINLYNKKDVAEGEANKMSIDIPLEKNNYPNEVVFKNCTLMEGNDIASDEVSDINEVAVVIKGKIVKPNRNLVIFVSLFDEYNNLISVNDVFENSDITPEDLVIGDFILRAKLPIGQFLPRNYRICVSSVIHYQGWALKEDEINFDFRFIKTNFSHAVYSESNFPMTGKAKPGYLNTSFNWELTYEKD